MSAAAVDAGRPTPAALPSLRPNDAGLPKEGAARRPRRGALVGNAARGRSYLRYPDGDLMSLMGGGDAEAFAALYDRHGRAAYTLAHRKMGEHQAAEDLTQDAFLKIWRSASGYRPERGSVKTWVLSIVHNRGIDQLRSMASRRRTQDRVERSSPRSQPSEAFAEAWRNRQREQVREALETLPAEQLKILELAYFSGYTQAERACMLGIPLGTVKGRARLGLKKVGDSLRLGGAVDPTGRGSPDGRRTLAGSNG